MPCVYLNVANHGWYYYRLRTPTKKSSTSISSNEIASLTRSRPSIKDDPGSMNTKWPHRGQRGYASLRMCSHPLPFYATPWPGPQASGLKERIIYNRDRRKNWGTNRRDRVWKNSKGCRDHVGRAVWWMNFDLTVYSYHGLIEEAKNAILVAMASYSQRDVKNISGHRRRRPLCLPPRIISNRSCSRYRSALLKIYLTLNGQNCDIYKLLEQLWHTRIRLRYFIIFDHFFFFYLFSAKIEDFSFAHLATQVF